MKNLLDKLNKLELDNKKILLIILICLIILYLDFSFIIKLQLQGIRTVGAKIIKLKTDIDNLTKDLSRLEELRRTVTQTKQETVLKAQKIISEEELPLLLQDISDLANMHKVKIMQIKPSKDTKAKEEAIAKVKILPVMLTLDLSCSYHSLGSFINALENTKQFIAVQDLKIRRSSDDYFRRDVDLLLKTYVKK